MIVNQINYDKNYIKKHKNQITYLNIYTSNFFTIPKEIFLLKKLEHLQIHDSELNEIIIPKNVLLNLKFCSLTENCISILDNSFLNLLNLEILYLNTNNFHIFPNVICQFKNLTRLVFSKNFLTSLPASIENLISLSYLDISFNEISSLPDSFGKMVNLTNLYISDNKLISLPKSFKNLKKLNILRLENNQLSNFSFRLSSLNLLNIENNKLLKLPELKNIEYLSFFGNKIIYLQESYKRFVRNCDNYFFYKSNSARKFKNIRLY